VRYSVHVREILISCSSKSYKMSDDRFFCMSAWSVFLSACDVISKKNTSDKLPNKLKREKKLVDNFVPLSL